MRTEFVRTLTEIAESDPRILLLTGDLGFMALEPFSERFPDRFINVGVAEQNMVGLATGLAEAGFIPFVYSIVTFAALRPYEFIRNGPILHQLPVRVVGMGGGFDYGTAGITHHGLEDVAVMRAQPGMATIVPADSAQARTAMLATRDFPRPIYFRLGKDDRVSIPGLEGRFRLGHAETVREGQDVLLVTMGSVSAETVKAAEMLSLAGIEATVMVVASVNPAPGDDLQEAVSSFPVAVTVEAHYATGGLGSLVSEVIADTGAGCRNVRCGVNQPLTGRTGSTAYLQDSAGVSARGIADAVSRALGRLNFELAG